jgi:hypothetical protein
MARNAAARLRQQEIKLLVGLTIAQNEHTGRMGHHNACGSISSSGDDRGSTVPTSSTSDGDRSTAEILRSWVSKISVTFKATRTRSCKLMGHWRYVKEV